MNPEIKQQWIEALRSGRYKQGQGSLRDHDEYCCLGVLCDLAEQAGIVKSNSITGWSFIYSSLVDRFDESDLNLPIAVMNWAGIDLNYGVEIDVAGKLLSNRNDQGDSFDVIADVIEVNL